MSSPVLENSLHSQPRVRAFLERSLEADLVSHAYLFCGNVAYELAGAARAFAQALVCPKEGCGDCGECQRVAHGTHPDVNWLFPGSARRGYLVDQIREVIADASMSPVRASRKIYGIEAADRLGAQAANALLKTLEEPSSSVVFVLMAPTADSVLPTIRSRCTIVPFAVADPLCGLEATRLATAASEETALWALALTGSVAGAEGFLASERRQKATARMLDVLSRISTVRDRELFDLAEELVASAKGAGADLSQALVSEQAAEEEFLSVKAKKDAEIRRKREESARVQETLEEVVGAAELIVRDALARVCGAESAPLDPLHDAISSELSLRGEKSLVAALDVLAEALRNLRRPITRDLVLQVMLLRLKEALCPVSAL